MILYEDVHVLSLERIVTKHGVPPGFTDAKYAAAVSMGLPSVEVPVRANAETTNKAAPLSLMHFPGTFYA